MKDLQNLLLFILICFVVYIIFRSFHFNYREGMTNSSSKTNNVTNTNLQDGIAGNAASYAASLKENIIKNQDTLLISKYRSDYESAIINLDDLINNHMLMTALKVNRDSPYDSIKKLSEMQQAKIALNSVMKYIDSQ